MHYLGSQKVAPNDIWGSFFPVFAALLPFYILLESTCLNRLKIAKSVNILAMNNSNLLYKDLKYREAILGATSSLNSFASILFDKMFEIAVRGELKEWANTVPDKETHEITPELFEGCDDINIRACISIWREVYNNLYHIINTNEISEKELNDYIDNQNSEMFSNDSEDVEDDDRDTKDDLPF